MFMMCALAVYPSRLALPPSFIINVPPHPAQAAQSEDESDPYVALTAPEKPLLFDDDTRATADRWVLLGTSLVMRG